MKFTYQIDAVITKELEKTLKFRGEEGWELVNFDRDMEDPKVWLLIFKKQVVEAGSGNSVRELAGKIAQGKA